MYDNRNLQHLPAAYCEQNLQIETRQIMFYPLLRCIKPLLELKCLLNWNLLTRNKNLLNLVLSINFHFSLNLLFNQPIRCRFLVSSSIGHKLYSCDRCDNVEVTYLPNKCVHDSHKVTVIHIIWCHFYSTLCILYIASNVN